MIPLEILPAGQFDPLYRSPLDIQAGELPVLPMSIYGAGTPILPRLDHKKTVEVLGPAHLGPWHAVIVSGHQL